MIALHFQEPTQNILADGIFSAYRKHMLTVPDFKEPSLKIGEVARLLPELPKKTIRNLTERGLVGVVEQVDTRLYSVANLVELATMAAFASGEGSYQTGALLAAMAVYRAEERINAGLIGTGENICAAVCLIEAAGEGQALRWLIKPFAEVGGLLEEMAQLGRPHFHVLAIDGVIELVVGRWKAMRHPEAWR